MNIQINKKWMIIICISVLIVCCFYYFYAKEPVKSEVVMVEEMDMNEFEETKETISVNEKERVDNGEERTSIVIDVKGAVLKPGVYEVPVDSRVYEAIQEAGGLSENADELAVNLASPLQDGIVVYIPIKGETKENPFISQNVAEDPSQKKVNINLATSEELQTLTGIGPSKAESIISYREEQGPFTKIEDLLEVTGIGDKSFEKLREEIAVK
ncbi:helix-hairpin-helix domain-containing protein [Metabacillus halosaccharovorans]|uniref:Helix-hairpin-helix domain-containing protein n=1 Tax=Metabacillus halosaccharovorans TaxID=930124 RepID=A0ABT3DCZ6_9BACI|nr:helix-hairpin-helix domain-containing protein [Metabacillus halosaccharovorans]MCV9884923.1 helix-hairpin-helix domain-containing protein [Metabacillus halosaccharovorans]